ncbi:MAG: hypothetical protein RLP44_20570 [Aggregatilineales bacterium]
MRGIALCLVLVLLFGGRIKAQDGCATTQLESGGFGRVTPGEANNVRDAPISTGELVGQIPGDGAFAMTENDPVCAGSRLWVEVVYADFTGWTVEANGTDYWVVPYDATSYEDSVVRFIYPTDFLTEIETETVPAQEQMGGRYPIRQEYTLGMDIDEENINRFFYRMIVMPTADITDDAPLALESLEKLRALLINQPALDESIFEIYDPNEPSDETSFLPADPLFLGARRTFISSAHYITAQNGAGVGFVTMYAQDILPIHNFGLFYNALILTDDGEFMAILRIPIRTDEVMDDYREFDFPANWDSLYAGHIINTTNLLDSLAPDDWQPSLDTLATIAGSIYVKGDIPDLD